MTSIPPNGTVLDALTASLRQAGHYNRSAMVAPAVILWPDESRQWEAIVPLLRDVDPMLLTLGEYAPALRRGPAIWLRALLARQLDAANWSTDAAPIVYLPGVGRGTLRAAESCSKDIRPLAELQYRGAFWSQQNARDWTVYAFLKASEGLGLDVAHDSATIEAMQRSVIMLADTAVARLRERRLEAEDFDELLAPDLERDMLRWMNDPKATSALWSSECAAAFRSLSRARLSFDPKGEGELGAAERMAIRAGEWKNVWARFAESPRSYPGIAALLERAKPAQLQLEPAYWPSANQKMESELRAALAGLEHVGRHDAAKKIAELEALHGPRRGWVWAQLDRAPLSIALKHLSTMADVCSKPFGGATAESMAEGYSNAGWPADDAVLQALAMVERGPDVDAVKVAIRAVYEPWLEHSAKHLQELTRNGGYPGHQLSNQTTLKPDVGECVVFVDGLRFDLGHRLRTALLAEGLTVALTSRWSPLPSVTATGKAAVSPIADQLGGGSDCEDFAPAVSSTGEKLTTDRFRRLLASVGIEYIDRDVYGTPAGLGWTEFGDVDSAGHVQGWKLARRIDEQLREVLERIVRLFAAGWTKVSVVTDHGWLLLPGGLPKAELPVYLADSRWGRCAALKSSASGNDQLVVSWRWSSAVRIALAPGICCFRAGLEYTHGGLSVQECVTPVLEVTKGVAAQQAVSILDVAWTGMRCRVRISGAPARARLDLRLRPADPASSKSAGAKEFDKDGQTSVLVEDDSFAGAAAFVVVLSEEGSVLAKDATCVGGD